MLEVVGEVNVKPLASRVLCLVPGYGHKLGSDPPTPTVAGDHRVFQPGMGEAIPDHVDKTDQPFAVTGSYPSEAVAAHQSSPVPFRVAEDPGTEGSSVELVDLGVPKLTAPVVADRHDGMLPITSHDIPALARSPPNR